MLAPIDNTTNAATRGVVQNAAVKPAADKPAAPTGQPVAAPPSGVRSARPDDTAFLTVEPDGRDDPSFADRLRHALLSVFSAVQKPAEAQAAADRAVEAIGRALDAAAASGETFFAQIRVVGIDVAFAEAGGEDTAFASYRRLGVEIGIARGGQVRAEDTAVVGLDGRSLGLTTAQTRTGIAGGVYRQVETAPAGPDASGKARERLEAAQAGLARVKAMQDALGAYRRGDIDPLKRLLVDGESPAAGRFGAVFPGTGALTLN
jgi:hypothetical protein